MKHKLYIDNDSIAKNYKLLENKRIIWPTQYNEYNDLYMTIYKSISNVNCTTEYHNYIKLIEPMLCYQLVSFLSIVLDSLGIFF